MKIHSTAGLLAACTLAAAAAAPAPFAVLDMEHAKTRAVRTVIQDADYFCNLPQETKKSKTFLIGEWDYNTMRPHVNLKSENPFPLQKLAMVVSKGDYGFKGFLLRAYAPLTNLSVKTGELRSDGGNVIAQENILAARVAESIDYPAADILMPPEMKKVPDKALLGFAILVNIPGTAVPGVYHTTITVTADGQSRQLPLSVRVPDFALPEADIPIGSYLVYYASDQGGREGRWAGKDYKAARQGKYFHFLATRGMNSSSIFHYCPEFTSGDSAEIKFDTLDSLMEKIVAGGSCKAMTFDLRYLIGNAARLAKLKKFQDAGKDDVADIPHRVKTTKKEISGNVYVITDNRGYVFIRRRTEKGLLSGLYEFPWSEKTMFPSAQDTGMGVTHIFTHIRLTLRIYRLQSDNLSATGCFVPPQKLKDYPSSTLMKKVYAAVRPLEILSDFPQNTQ